MEVSCCPKCRYKAPPVKNRDDFELCGTPCPNCQTKLEHMTLAFVCPYCKFQVPPQTVFEDPDNPGACHVCGRQLNTKILKEKNIPFENRKKYNLFQGYWLTPISLFFPKKEKYAKEAVKEAIIGQGNLFYPLLFMVFSACFALILHFFLDIIGFSAMQTTGFASAMTLIIATVLGWNITVFILAFAIHIIFCLPGHRNLSATSRIFAYSSAIYIFFAVPYVNIILAPAYAAYVGYALYLAQGLARKKIMYIIASLTVVLWFCQYVLPKVIAWF